MLKSTWGRIVALGAALIGAGGMVASAGPVAAAAPSTSTLRVGCGHDAYTTISGAVAAASVGDTVVVCPGTYAEDVLVTKAVDLVGHNATIDAAGLDNGIVVSASGATVEGFTVEQATGEGILVTAGASASSPVSHVTISGNTVINNDLGASMPDYGGYAECAPAGPVPGDCGEGIHLMTAEDVTVTHNVVSGNTGGVLLTDEFGATDHNLIAFNKVFDNLYDCGVTLAGHSTAGVYDNTVAHNVIDGNGVLGQGGGVLMATGTPGGAVYDNTVTHNSMEGNGLAGVTVHSHIPGQNLNGNVISDNVIKVNNLSPDKDFFPYWDPYPTGVIVAVTSPGTVSITVAGNVFMKNTYGVWAMSGVTFTGGLSSNVFTGSVGQPLCSATSTPGCS